MAEIENEVEYDCRECEGLCCRHVPIEIDTPSCKRDYDTIRWYLHHENVRVFIDHYRKWHVEFMTPCEHITKDNKCKEYASRPKLCKDYPSEEHHCENFDLPYTTLFKNAKEYEAYLEKKGKEWRWKR